MGLNTRRKKSSALSRIVVGGFSREVQIMKTEAFECRRRISGRRLRFATGQRFKLTEVDGAVFGMENVLVATINGDNLERLVSDWDTRITGMKKRPEDQVLEAIITRQLRCVAR